jgi:hypothetical protein
MKEIRMNRPSFIALALVLGVGASPLAASDHHKSEPTHAQRVAWADHDHDRAAREHHLKREELRHQEREHRFHAQEHRRDEHLRARERHEKHLPPGQAKKLSDHRDRYHHGI